jgi:hypothetical protein
MQRLQGTKLFDDEEQEEEYRAARNEEVLPQVPSSHSASRNEIKIAGQ